MPEDGSREFIYLHVHCGCCFPIFGGGCRKIKCNAIAFIELINPNHSPPPQSIESIPPRLTPKSHLPLTLSLCPPPLIFLNTTNYNYYSYHRKLKVNSNYSLRADPVPECP